MALNAHPTKSGPGRRHKDYEKHGAAPVAPTGAPFGFVQHVATREKKLRRLMVETLGRRQARRLQRAERALDARGLGQGAQL